MSAIVQLTAQLARGTEETQDKLLEYPKRGTLANGRSHPSVPATWDGTGPVPFGWSSYRGSSRQHPTLQQFATTIDPESAAAMANGRRLRLNAAEQTKMAADLAAAVVSLPNDWLPQQIPAQVGGKR